MASSVLFDAPGPRARTRNAVATVIAVLVLGAVAYAIYARFDARGQWQARLWKPFLQGQTWTDYIIPGLLGTLKAAGLGAVCAIVLGVVLGLARLSDRRWLRMAAGAVVEVFRAIPLLLLIFFIFYLAPSVFGGGDYALIAVVAGLTLYNGSVLAEVFRAGILSIPRGQSEAAYALGMRKGQVMRTILLPQGVTVMMPAIVSQLVVLLKDTALGYIIAYVDLLNMGFKIIPAVFFGSLIPAAIVIGIIYIGINMSLSALATWLERRPRRIRKAA
jgi:glutamate transport system permease protein